MHKHSRVPLYSTGRENEEKTVSSALSLVSYSGMIEVFYNNDDQLYIIIIVMIIINRFV